MEQIFGEIRGKKPPLLSLQMKTTFLEKDLLGEICRFLRNSRDTRELLNERKHVEKLFDLSFYGEEKKWGL